MKRFNLKPLDILVILTLIVMSIGGYIFLFRNNTSIEIRVKVTDKDILYAFNNPSAQYASQFSPGDVELDGLGKVKSKILAVYRYDSADIPQPGKKILYLDISTKAVFDSRTQSYQAKGQNLAYGTPLRFIFNHVQFDGVVTDVKNLPNFYTPTTHLIEATIRDSSRYYSETYGVPKFMADAVKIGDTIAIDPNSPLIKVVNVVKKPALRSIVTNSGVRLVTDPLLYDVTYSLEVSAKTIDNTAYVFDTIPLKIGTTLPLNFSQAYIQPTITAISPIPNSSQ